MPAATSQQESLNGQSGFILAVYIVVSFFVIYPVKIPLLNPVQRLLLSFLKHTRIIGQREYRSLSARRLHFPLRLETAPLIAVFLLLATTTIDGSTITLGIKGNGTIKPYDVLVLFISLAYISIALDGTGALEAVAFWVSKRGGTSGRRLFAVFYSFFFLAGCIIGNDPLILSGTPFLSYLTKHANLDPTPWIFSEFMAANTASAVLVSSNPTNILITGTFSLNYLTDFTKWTILPSVLSALVNYPILFFMFRKTIPKTLLPLQDDPWSKLNDARAAVFLSSLLLITLAVLVGTTFVPGGVVQVWMVTAPAGILAFLFTIGTDLWNSRNHRTEFTEKEGAELQNIGKKSEEEESSPNPSLSAGNLDMKKDTPTNSDNTDQTNLSLKLDSVPTVEDTPTTDFHDQAPVDVFPKSCKLDGSETTALTPTLSDEPQCSSKAITSIEMSPNSKHDGPTDEKTFTNFLHILSTNLPVTTLTVKRLPLPLLPFAASYFILTRGLAQRGWVRIFALGFAQASTSVPSTIFLFGFVCAAFLCPLAGTNIGATIILVEMLTNPSFTSSPNVSSDTKILNGAIYATAMGSNLGAFSYTFSGSLAGLLWRRILKQKGIEVSPWKFAAVNLMPLIVQTAVTCFIVWGEVYWFS